MKCRYFREWALYGIKPAPTKLSVRQYWWPSVNSVNMPLRASLAWRRHNKNYETKILCLVVVRFALRHLCRIPRHDATRFQCEQTQLWKIIAQTANFEACKFSHRFSTLCIVTWSLSDQSRCWKCADVKHSAGNSRGSFFSFGLVTCFMSCFVGVLRYTVVVPF